MFTVVKVAHFYVACFSAGYCFNAGLSNLDFRHDLRNHWRHQDGTGYGSTDFGGRG